MRFSGGALFKHLLRARAVDHDPALDIFDRGCWELTRDGEFAGHVASVLWTFRSLGRPLTDQDWIWFVVVFASGDRNPFPIEDYPPWSYVSELLDGHFDHEGVDYAARRLSLEAAEAKWAELGITEGDF